MTPAASVDHDARLRLFLALRLPDDWLDELVAWQRRVFAGSRGVRIVPREQLHVTLVFLGSTPAAELPAVLSRLEAAARPVELRPAGYRETRSVAMLTFEDVGGHGGAFADAAGRDEGRPWLPHLTVARFRERPKLREEFPDRLRTHVLVPSDAAAYLSRLRPTGAEYEVLAAFDLQARYA